MEKYGVKELEQEKTANSEHTCPVCGEELKALEVTGGVKVCPKCGTKPFEAA